MVSWAKLTFLDTYCMSLEHEMLFVNTMQAIAWKKIRSYAFPTFLVGLSCMPVVVSIISGIHVGKWFSIRGISPPLPASRECLVITTGGGADMLLANSG